MGNAEGVGQGRTRVIFVVEFCMLFVCRDEAYFGGTFFFGHSCNNVRSVIEVSIICLGTVSLGSCLFTLPVMSSTLLPSLHVGLKVTYSVLPLLVLLFLHISPNSPHYFNEKSNLRGRGKKAKSLMTPVYRLYQLLCCGISSTHDSM